MRDFPHIEAVLAGPVPDLILATWQELAGEHRATGTYASYLSFEKIYPYQGSPTAVAVQNNAPYARALEDGRAGFHLPSSIDWGAALGRGTAKMGRRGVPYLSVPFRHGTPGSPSGGIGSGRNMMSRTVYAAALQVLKAQKTARDSMDAAARAKASERLRDATARLRAGGTRLSRPYAIMAATDEPRGVAGWRRGRSLHELTALARQQDGQPGYTWRSRTYEGLTHRTQTNPESGRASGVWMTFRTVAADSLGFWIPPMTGYRFAARTVERVREALREMIGAAAREDVAAYVRLVGAAHA